MQAVSIICASPPLLKPTPIRPVCRRAIEAQAEKIEVTPLQPRRAGPTERRPSMLRATTLDGRSLEEVIQAAHRASRYDQVTVKTPSTPQYQSTSYTYQSRPHLRTERRESWHSNSTDHSYHPNPHQRSRPSSMDDVQAYDYPYQYPSRHDYSLTSHPY